MVRLGFKKLPTFLKGFRFFPLIFLQENGFLNYRFTVSGEFEFYSYMNVRLLILFISLLSWTFPIFSQEKTALPGSETSEATTESEVKKTEPAKNETGDKKTEPVSEETTDKKVEPVEEKKSQDKETSEGSEEKANESASEAESEGKPVLNEKYDWFYWRSEFRELNQKKHAVDLELYELKKKYRSLEKERKELDNRLVVVKRERSTEKLKFDEEKKVLEEKVSKTENTLKETNETHSKEKDALLKEKTALEEKSQKQVEDIKKLEEAKKTCDTEMTKLKEQIASLEKEKKGVEEKHKAELAKVQEELKKSEDKLARLKLVEEKENEFNKQVTELKVKVQEADTRNTDLEKKIEEKNQENKALNDKMVLVEQKFADFKDKQDKLKVLIEEMSADRKAKQELLDKINNRFTKLEEKLKEELALGDIRLSKTSNRLVINLSEKISFRSGSSKLRSTVKPTLDKIMEIITEFDDYVVAIEGHTDNVPVRKRKELRDNWQLSTERALSVLQYILKSNPNKYSPPKFSAAGYGEYHPVQPNDSEPNKALNRRVDIVVTYR